ncbi:cytochrome P450 2J4-like [Amphiura filiformis]|uniref:cytochrome P450 2J4-like n=1 Tax=Amphiura filiformis TaxID=82378 RepID=UPI003B21A2C8
MAAFVIDASTALIAVLVFLVILYFFRKPTNLPPGPWGLPILGCLPSLAYYVYRTGCNAKEPFRLFDYIAKDYGNVFSMHLATKLVVVVNDYESVREAFRNPHLNDRPMMALIPASETGVLLACGHTWNRQRRFTLSTFRDFGIGKSRFQDQISTETEYVIKEFAKYQSNPIDPRRILTIAISNVICAVVFGKRFEYTDIKFQELLHLLEAQFEASASGGILFFVPFVAHFFPAFKRITKETNEHLVRFVNEIVKEHRNNFDSDNLKDYMDVFLNEINASSTKENERSIVSLSDDNLIHSVLQLFVAGSETTVSTLRWCFLYMIAYPDIQRRVQDEIDSVVGRNSLPRVGDKLPFTQATIMEVQRIADIVPLGVPHAAAADTTLRGYFIPKGTMIMSNLWAIHHNQDTWDEPENFKPERFLDSNGDLCHKNEYAPFSIGRRACLGENLAKMELFVYFTHLLHQFSFKKPEESPPITFESTLGATNAPLPFKLIVTKR